MLNVIVLISGSGSNLKAILEASREPENGFRVAGVAADVNASGLRHAESFGVPYAIIDPQQFASREAWGDALGQQLAKFGATTDAQDPWLIVSAGLMRILPANFVRRFSPQLINTHPALLPKYPGAHAVRDALADDATQTGCTVHVIDEGVDTGPVIRQSAITIEHGETEPDLHERIKEIERPLLIQVIEDIAHKKIDLAEVAGTHHS
ncbi:MAG: phosphoribosylglycinamide formyltransferase [Canibacter sp.]